MITDTDTTISSARHSEYGPIQMHELASARADSNYAKTPTSSNYAGTPSSPSSSDYANPYSVPVPDELAHYAEFVNVDSLEAPKR